VKCAKFYDYDTAKCETNIIERFTECKFIEVKLSIYMKDLVHLN